MKYFFILLAFLTLYLFAPSFAPAQSYLNITANMIKDVEAGKYPSNPAFIAATSHGLLFTAIGGNETMYGNLGNDLWITDGTSAGTIKLKGGIKVMTQPGTVGVELNGTVYFGGGNASSEGLELWKTDGTTTGTVKIKNINTSLGGDSWPCQFIVFNGVVYFEAQDQVHGTQLWRTDGTANGTTMVADILNHNGPTPAIWDITQTGGAMYFTAGDGLYRSDGTAAGTVRIFTGSTMQTSLLKCNGLLYFTAHSDSLGYELATYDPVSDKVAQEIDVNPGPAGSSPLDLVSIGDEVFFLANDGGGTINLWKTDGTKVGTMKVTDLAPEQLRVYNNALVFQARNGANQAIWKSDGTVEGTIMLKEMTGAGFIPYRGLLFFQGHTGDGNSELWRTDGTSGGTVLALDLCPGLAGSAPFFFTVMNDEFYFTARDGVHGTEPWKMTFIPSGPHTHVLSTHSLKFDIRAPSQLTQSVTITNTSLEPLFISSVGCEPPCFTVTPSSSTIPPGAIQSFEVRYANRKMGMKGTIIFSNSGGDLSDTVFAEVSSGDTGTGVQNPPVAPLRANHVGSGWNLVAVSHLAANMDKASIFPSAISSAYGYDGAYHEKSTLDAGTGYWVKFPSECDNAQDGDPITEQTISVTNGWNLIGSITAPVATADIAANIPGVALSRFFGYNSRYQTVDTLLPGLGYWVRVNQACQLSISAAGVMPGKNRVSISNNEIEPPPPPTVTEARTQLPIEFSLGQNYPNPFNPSTLINYTLASSAYVTLKVYNTLGQEIASLVNGQQEAGYKMAKFEITNLPSGIYIYRLSVGSFTDTKKMILMK